MLDAVAVRPGGAEDLERIAEIQSRSPEASQWEPAAYLEHDLRVVEYRGRVEGFSVARRVSPEESELLNLAVAPECRRRGLGRALLEDLVRRHGGTVYLEVRESNTAAQKFYQAFRFEIVGVRPRYYQNPPESAVVMRLRSCYCHK